MTDAPSTYRSLDVAVPTPLDPAVPALTKTNILPLGRHCWEFGISVSLEGDLLVRDYADLWRKPNPQVAVQDYLAIKGYFPPYGTTLYLHPRFCYDSLPPGLKAILTVTTDKLGEYDKKVLRNYFNHQLGDVLIAIGNGSQMLEFLVNGPKKCLIQFGFFPPAGFAWAPEVPQKKPRK